MIIGVDAIEQAIQNGDTYVTLDPSVRNIDHTILAQPYRQYFIDKVKRPLQKAVEVLSKRFPFPTKQNTRSVIAHTMLDIFNEFHMRNKAREPLFQAASRILICELEHDGFYRGRFLWFAEECVKAMLDDKWEYRREEMQNWIDERPTHKERTLTYKLIQHRSEIKAILGEDDATV